jgi:uncharacterized protein (TIGR02996 family)
MHRRPRPELLALLADVKDHPDDRTPWLVLTDWLEEHGDEADRARAEYCRLCLPKMGLLKVTAAHYDLGERRRELFRQWGAAWLGPLAGCSPNQENGLFHVTVRQRLQIAEDELDERRETFAWVRRLAAMWPYFDPRVNAWGRSWSDLRELELWGSLTVEELIAFLERDDFPRLTSLLVTLSKRLTIPLANRLVKVGRLERFARLTVWGIRRTDEKAADVLREALGDRLRL